MEILKTLRLITDSGLFVLIWMVQLIAYPVFTYMKHESVQAWHSVYTRRISLIVMPFMAGQTVIYVLLLLKSWSTLYLVQALLILLVWIHTFVVFVPFHAKISQNLVKSDVFRALIAKNWVRTIIWSVLFIITLVSELYEW